MIVAHGGETMEMQAAGARVVQAFAAPFRTDKQMINCGVSVGMVPIGKDATSTADLLRFADLALYRAKNEGRGQACIYDSAMSEAYVATKQLENDLRGAIVRRELNLVYQPVMAADGIRMIGVEALCRWEHPTLGMIPPARFIAVAEQSELIIPLGQWVLHQACLDAQLWPGLTVAVNVSALQFRRPDFVSR